MAYNSRKDKVLKEWRPENSDLVITLNKYGNGQPKLQIGPREYTPGAFRKAGRLDHDEMSFLAHTVVPEATEIIFENVYQR